MGKSGYAKCEEIMERIKGFGFNEEIDVKSLKRIIMETVGIDRRTVGNYITVLQELGFLETTNQLTFTLRKGSQ